MNLSGTNVFTAMAHFIEPHVAQLNGFQHAVRAEGAQAAAQFKAFQVIAGPASFQTPSLLSALPIWRRPLVQAREHSFFAGTNYLGLAGNTFVRAASALAVLKYGSSFSGSRTTTGTSRLHLLAENKIAEFMNTEDACLLASGAHANAALVEALARRHHVLFYEKSAHPSLVSAARAAFRHVRPFDQDDITGLSNALRSVRSAVVVLNGIDPATGRIAPLPEIMVLSVAKDIQVVVDDCHAVGVLGANGRGTPEHFGIHSENVFQSGTMSKAFGGHGGFVAGSRELCAELRRTGAYIGSSALPASDSAACFMSLCIALRNPELLTKLRENARYAAQQLRALGLAIPHDGTPVLQISNVQGDEAEKLSSDLRKAGIEVNCITYPTSTSPRRLRIVITAAHTQQDIDRLCQAIRDSLRPQKP